MKVYFLGTGSAVATAKRDNTSLYIENDNWNILIDCPGSIIQKFSLLSVDYTKLNSIFITHSHPDHLYGLPSIIHSLDPFDIHPKIFIPSEFMEKAVSLLKIFDLLDKADIISVDFAIKEYESMTLFPTRHMPGSKGIKIISGNTSFVYTSDTGPLNESKSILNNVDYLIHDCYAPVKYKESIPALDSTHTSAESLGKIAADCSIKHLIPIHFSGEHDFTDDNITDEINKYYKGNIIIPSDLQVIET